MIIYKQAFSKMEIAYLKGEVNAFDGRFCFCGNLEDNTTHWQIKADLAVNYTREEYIRMEEVYMAPLRVFSYKYPTFSQGMTIRSAIAHYNKGTEINQEYEDANFQGFCDALEVLANIHKSRGEDIDLSLKLTKKQAVRA